MATDLDAVVAVLRRLADGDDAVLADPETFPDFEQAVSRLQAREPFLADAFPRAAIIEPITKRGQYRCLVAS
jgi:chromatin segregation and condensation protein Rec8/ScpA/Scc1 (kleisin family)